MLSLKENTPEYIYNPPNVFNFADPLNNENFLKAALSPSKAVAPMINPICSFGRLDLQLRLPAISLVHKKKLQHRSDQLQLLSSCKLAD